eukprot:UN14965
MENLINQAITTTQTNDVDHEKKEIMDMATNMGIPCTEETINTLMASNLDKQQIINYLLDSM